MNWLCLLARSVIFLISLILVLIINCKFTGDQTLKPVMTLEPHLSTKKREANQDECLFIAEDGFRDAIWSNGMAKFAKFISLFFLCVRKITHVWTKPTYKVDIGIPWLYNLVISGFSSPIAHSLITSNNFKHLLPVKKIREKWSQTEWNYGFQ